MASDVRSRQELLRELEELALRLQEAEDTLEAIRTGGVDALIVATPQGEQQLFTLEGADKVYRIFLESIAEGAVTISDESVVLYANGAAGSLLSRDGESVVGHRLRDAVRRDDRQRFEALLAAAKTGPASGEVRLRGKKGARSVYLSLRPIPELGESAIAGVLTDLAEQKKAEQALEAERLARSILEQTSEAIVVCDTKGMVIRASSSVRLLAGREPLFQRFDEVLPLSRPDGGRWSLARQLTALRPIHHREVQLACGDSVPTRFLMNLDPLTTRSDGLIGVVVTLTDVTALKQAQDRLQEQGEELRCQQEELQVQTEELRQQTEELESARKGLEAELSRTLLLQDLARAASEGLDLPTIGDATLAALRDRLQLKGGDIRIVDDKTLRLLSSFNYPQENLAVLRQVDLETSPLLGAVAVRECRILTHQDEVFTPQRAVLLKRQGIELDRYVYVPIAHHDQILGLLALIFEGRRAFRDDELSLFEAIARLLGQAIANARLLLREQGVALENARLFDEQRHIATTLQESLMHRLPRIPQLEFGLAAEAAGVAELIGGDFSDALVLPSGLVLVLIGDVEGKGMPAAGFTETVRSTLRAFAAIDETPGFILRKTNDLLQQEPTPAHSYVTALSCVIDPTNGHVRLASAGHPPPVHLSPFSSVLLDMPFGPPLGSFPSDYEQIHLTLTPEDYLVLYTDGVTEARRGPGSELFGENRLLAAAEALRGCSAQAMADGLAAETLGYAGCLRDDLNIVVVRLA